MVAVHMFQHNLVACHAGSFCLPLKNRLFRTFMTEKIDTLAQQPRTPIRKRGIERFEHLLDCVAALIGEFPDDDISLAQVAERAGVPIASVYHFFPNRNAAFVALAQRYHRHLAQMSIIEGPSAPRRWQDVFEFRLRRSAAYLNSEPAALRLFMGFGVSVDVRNTDVAGNAALAERRAVYLREAYDIPVMPDLEHRIAISLALIDGIWALSYSNHKCITDEYLDEAVLAAVTYLRCYLPEYLQLKTP